MSFQFSEQDFQSITETLGVKPEEFGSCAVWKVKHTETNQAIVLSIHNNVQLDKVNSGTLISVQSQHGYFELHNCSAFMVFEPDEIIFVNYNDTKVSSLIIGRQATCSMYANISREILSADFANLDPAVLLSAMQLSLTETILD